jgi:segregation and condensation protein B
MEKIENILEALLFLSGDGIKIKEIAEKLAVKEKELKEAVKVLKEKYSGCAGIHIIEFNGKIQFSSNPDYAPIVESVLNPIKERELSKAMLEVSAIIAYKQPVTRLEIEEIRGVNSDYAITMLLKHNIIEVVGRKDTIGKPLLYGTADGFLKRFQLNSLDQLPDYNEILDRIKVLDTDESKDLYYRGQYTADNGGVNNATDTAAENTDTEISHIDKYYESEELPDFLKDEKNIKIIN